jgi:uncharacterized protein involved in exopolysaccharide biosynthesis
MDTPYEANRTHDTSGTSRYARLDTHPRHERTVQQFVDRRRPVVHSWQPQADRLVRWLKRRIDLVIVVTLVGGIGGFAFGTLTPPRFTATTDMLVDPAKLQVVADDIYDSGAAREAQLLDAEGKLRILTSGNVLARVVADLELQTDPEFVPPATGSLFGFGGGSATKTDPTLIAQRNLYDHIRARREDRSFIVSLSVSSVDPEKTVQISNSIVRAFLAELAQADADGAAKSAQALIDRLAEMRADVNEAEERVEAFKRQNQLQSSEGELLSARSMTQLNTQMLEAQQRVIEAASRYEQLVGSSASANAAALQSPTIAALRAQYATAQQAYQSQAAVLGTLHPTLRTLRVQAEALAAQVDAETRRLVDAAKVEFDEAKSAVAELVAETEAARSTVSTDNEAQVQLRELERDATAASAIYEAYLARAREVTERQSIDTSNIRVITPATVPDSRSWPPRTMQTIIAGSATGLVVALLLAVVLGFWTDLRRARPQEAPSQ